VSREDVERILLEDKVVAVVRLDDAAALRRVVLAIREGGIRAIEITMTVPGAVEIIRGLSSDGVPGALIGAGTVLGATRARAVIDAGARFVVSPVLDEEVIRVCRERDVFVVPGAFSPTEILRARAAGADIVKVFPASVLGPAFFKDVRGPFPDIRLMPTGGISAENARSFIDAGADCVAVGTSLLSKRDVLEGRWDAIAHKAQTIVNSIK
jgi:2-dehydro-3-deoxyphosphogluconate aldolase/(4S)-4-hydroxy-2-oxoglutarate aldolase